jgi:hypothetical protein
MEQVHTFNLQMVVNEIDGKITLVIPKSAEKIMGIENVFGAIKHLGNTTFTIRNRQDKLTKTISMTPEVFRTCCGCECRTFHDSNDECRICGRTNPK